MHVTYRMHFRVCMCECSNLPHVINVTMVQKTSPEYICLCGFMRFGVCVCEWPFYGVDCGGKISIFFGTINLMNANEVDIKTHIFD